MQTASLITLLFGLTLFLSGMSCTDSALRLLVGSRIRHAVEAVTRNRFAALLVGILLTLATQSSSATTVMLVGFTTAGLLSVSQAVPVLLGSTIATTLTIQLFAWRATDAGPLVAAAGFLLSLVKKCPGVANSGRLAYGFGLIFYGMTLMSQSVMPLRHSPLVLSALRATDSAVVLLLFSALLTAVIQSSAATVALVISLATSLPGSGPALSAEKAVAVVLGADIGTSATAVLASLGAGPPGKRIAWAHVLYKIALAASALPFAALLARFGLWSAPGAPARQIANIYTLCNTVGALLFLPLSAWLARLMSLLLPEHAARTGYTVRFIDRDFRNIPYLALAQARKETVRMSGVVTDMFDATWRALAARDQQLLSQVRADDDKVDYLQETISRYLATLSEREIRPEESLHQFSLLAVVSELERIGDIISKDLTPSIAQLIERNLYFSAEGTADADELYRMVRLLLYRATDAVAENDGSCAAEIEAHAAEIAARLDNLRAKHFARLTHGQVESARTTTIHLDVLDDLRSVSSHCVRLCRALVPRSSLSHPPSNPGYASGVSNT